MRRLRLHLLPATGFASMLVVLLLVLAALACGPFPPRSKPTPVPATAAPPLPLGATQVESGAEPIVPPPPEQRTTLDDIPPYPGATRQVEQEAGWNAVDPQTGEAFVGDLRVYTMGNLPPDVLRFYEAELTAAGWSQLFEGIADEGGFVVWERPDGMGSSLQLTVIVSALDQGETTIVLLLARGGATPQAGNEGEGGLVTPAADGSTQPPSGMGLLPTPPLSMGIEGWQQWLQGGSRSEGHNTLQMAQDPMFWQVVQFSRSDDANDGGAVGIYQPLSLDVTSFQHVYVWLVGKVIGERGGNIANPNPQWFPEGAVQVRVKYVAASGQEAEWYHGFYVAPVTGADTVHFTQVPHAEWFRYVADLMALPDPPSRITEFRVYGFGWEFLGQVAEVDLIGSTE